MLVLLVSVSPTPEIRYDVFFLLRTISAEKKKLVDLNDARCRYASCIKIGQERCSFSHLSGTQPILTHNIHGVIQQWGSLLDLCYTRTFLEPDCLLYGFYYGRAKPFDRS